MAAFNSVHNGHLEILQGKDILRIYCLIVYERAKKALLSCLESLLHNRPPLFLSRTGAINICQLLKCLLVVSQSGTRLDFRPAAAGKEGRARGRLLGTSQHVSHFGPGVTLLLYNERMQVTLSCLE